MTDHPARVTRPAAPVPIGDVVAGHPPVPITVWQVPAPHLGDTMSNGLGERLVHNFTHPTEIVVDLTDGTQLARAIIVAARRRQHLRPDVVTSGWHSPALIVTGWPTPGHGPGELFTACRARLRPGGCIAVVIAHTDPIVLADLIVAAHTVNLGYLQHIVAADNPPTRATGAGGGSLRVHSDVLILTRPHDTPSEIPHV